MMDGRTKRQIYAFPSESMKSTKSNKINSFLARLLSAADNLSKQFGSRSGPTECQFDTLIGFLKELFEKVYFIKVSK